jgi:glycosyltransferase involved in cell wall biosynthesis
MNTSVPLISIIIPTYNRAALLGKAIDSVLKQTYGNFQLIIVDDGSDDDTGLMIKGAYPQVEYILQDHAGQGKARNNGLKHARGTYIASLDSDDTWDPSFLEKCIAKLEQDNLDFVFANWLQVINKSHGFDFFLRSKLLDQYLADQTDNWVKLNYDELRQLYIRACPSPSSSLVIRRTSIKTGWNEQLNIADDWCLLLDIILTQNCRAAFTTQRLWLKQTDGKNIYDGRNYFEVLELLYVKDFDSIVKVYRHLLTKNELAEIKNRTALNIYRYTINRIFHGVDIWASSAMFVRALRIAPMLLFSELARMVGKQTKIIARNLIKKRPINDLELIAISQLNLNQDNAN